ncbi:TlpA family protein disulfide reductase [Echinicola sp. CAU 1574]|uniref:TlpA family protein disulfide reductase n=1 Tax=Echinicola arenosa TaxID=2774144 RepID=A0ABR9AFW3_9BACT|nr:TlpA disulfide reductase family protein [Echinicola arenosa]MBD8487754.1 TlpA family protein disulfide reductase [Echinicola arenosa]
MKKFCKVLLVLTVLTQTALMAKGIEGYAIISGKVDFENPFGEVKLQQVVDGALETVATSSTNEKGEFAFMYPVDEAAFYHLEIAPRRYSHMLRFYLESGVELKVTIQEDGYVLAGEDLGHNELVTDWNKSVEKMLDINRVGSVKTYKEFFPLVKNEMIDEAQDFKNRINTGDEQFDALMKLSVQTDLEEQSFSFFRFPRTMHASPEEYPDFYQQWEKDVKFTDADLLKLWNGKSYMDNYFMTYYLFLENPKPVSSKPLSGMIPSFDDPALLDVFLRDYFSTRRFKGGQFEREIAIARPYMTSEESKALIVELEKKYFTEAGQPGFKFEYEDVEGNMVSFDSFKGKVVYLDIWATWCGPCIKQIPSLKKLEEELHGEDIVFLSVSIDALKDKQKWKNFVKEKDLKGVQLMADKAWESGLVKNYEIKGIPRFMIFDKQGNIVTTDAMRPSQEGLKEQLVELLKK